MKLAIPKTCFVAGEPEARYVLLQPVDEHDLAAIEEETAALNARLCVPYCLIACPVADWNRDLSPWPAPPVFGKVPFGGEAEKTLSALQRNVLPALTDKTVLLGGYSLAGFFALWAAYRTDAFRGVAAVSPSVWYPGWMDYAASHKPHPKHLYLSLGDREERAKNPVMARVGDCIREQYRLLSAGGSSAVLEWNAGNHFQQTGLRTAKGFAWLVEQIEREKAV